MGALADLAPRCPRRSWEGWFLIGIGEPGCPIRWFKSHLYRRRWAGSRWLHPVSALEGIRDAELVTFVATDQRVDVRRRPLAPDEPRVAAGGFALELPDELAWRGEPPQLTLRGDAGQGVAYDVELAVRDRLVWVRAPRVLGYVGLLSSCVGEVRAPGLDEAFRGLGILEHAWGAMVPFDPAALIRGPWHWDVLALDGGDGAAVAALSVPLPLLGPRGVRAGGRLPGDAFGYFGDFRVEVLARADGVPSRWVGRMTTPRGELRYECAAATPVARAAPGVYFFGTDFEASVDGRRYAGRGFTECGGPRAT